MRTLREPDKSAIWLVGLAVVAFTFALVLLATSWASPEPRFAPAERGTVAISDVAAPPPAVAHGGFGG